MSETLLIGGSMALLAAIVFYYAGRAVGSRELHGDARVAVLAFQVWWYALAAVTLLGAAQSLAAAVGFTSLGVMLTLTNINLLAITVALWGLMYYMTYLFVGGRGALKPLVIFYAGVYLLLASFFSTSDPMGVEVGRWSVSIEYAEEPSGLVTAALIGAILIPQIGAAIALFGTLFRLEDRSQRFRAGMVSVSIFIWFGSSLGASAAGLGEHDWWQLVSRAISLAASLAILMAYRPPSWVRRRLSVEPWAPTPG